MASRLDLRPPSALTSLDTECWMREEPVDVLIIGAGASGAAFAWSLADTRINILCLEQGDWMNPADYPSNSIDWELCQFGDFALSPNSRGRR